VQAILGRVELGQEGVELLVALEYDIEKLGAFGMLVAVKAIATKVCTLNRTDQATIVRECE